MNNTYFKNLCLKYLTNDINDSERSKLLSMIESSSSYKEEFEEVKKTWEMTSVPNIDLNIDTEDEWLKLNNRIISESIERDSKKSVGTIIKNLFAPKLRPAFAALSLAIIVVSSVLLFNNIWQGNKLIRVETSNHQKLNVTLSDGSVVTLNSGSSIEYFEDFEEEKREVKLNGEAFFSVKKDGRPFLISTKNAVTTVLGTKFNVWSRDEETRVIVAEGKVSLADNASLEKKVILTKGETSKIIADQSPSEPVMVDTDYMLGWLNGRIVFQNSSLNEIVNELERNYNVKIVLDGEGLGKYRLTGVFEDEKIDTVLSKICLALNLKYIEDNNNFRLTQ